MPVRASVTRRGGGRRRSATPRRAVVGKDLLPPDEGALVQKALEASHAKLFRAGELEGEASSRSSLGWSDALVQLAEAALTNIEGTSRLPADPFQIILHVDVDDPERARLHLGPWCRPRCGTTWRDATARLVLERRGTPVHVFARRRAVDDRLRALIEHRDQGCRVPGCGQRRRLHAHHLVHHEDGGLTTRQPVLPVPCPPPPAPRRTAGHRRRSDHTGRAVLHRSQRTADRGPNPRPPGVSPVAAAAPLGLPPPRWDPPLGEPLETHWITWS